MQDAGVRNPAGQGLKAGRRWEQRPAGYLNPAVERRAAERVTVSPKLLSRPAPSLSNAGAFLQLLGEDKGDWQPVD